MKWFKRGKFRVREDDIKKIENRISEIAAEIKAFQAELTPYYYKHNICKAESATISNFLDKIELYQIKINVI